jgi:hypothetical protein
MNQYSNKWSIIKYDFFLTIYLIIIQTKVYWNRNVVILDFFKSCFIFLGLE